jgi:kinesin family protein C1
MPIPTAKHKPSGCTLPLPIPVAPDRSLTLPVPEPAFKQRKTLAEQAGEPISRRLPPPTKISNGIKSTVARGLAASTSRTLSKPTVRHPAASTLSGSVGGAPKATGAVRPKSAYGHGTHARSKSYQQGPRPATAMLNRDDDDDSEQAERKGVQPFLISTNPSTSTRVLGRMPSHLKKRTTSLSVSQQRIACVSGPRAVSSPSQFRPVTPVIEEPADDDCDDICTAVGALTLGAAKADRRGSQVGRGMTSDYGTNPFLKPKIPPSQLPQPTPTSARQQQIDPSPLRPPSTTPRRSAQARFLNRFTNDRCPDFYNERMEAMERDFRMFKEKMETDVRQATDYKESIQQLQSRGTLRVTLLDLRSWALKR